MYFVRKKVVHLQLNAQAITIFSIQGEKRYIYIIYIYISIYDINGPREILHVNRQITGMIDSLINDNSHFSLDILL